MHTKHPIRIILTVILVFLLLVIAVFIYKLTTIPRASLGSIPVNDIAASSRETMDDYWNIVLFGVDSRTGLIKSKTRTDSIMLASINKKTGKVKLTSIYRDTLVYIDADHGYTKLNAAYAYGGPEKALTVINQNLDLNVQDFITVNFNSLAAIVDVLGGVKIDIQEDEIKQVNNYTRDVAKILGTKKVKITEPGYQTLNGTQAVAYCRVRYTSGGDFRRTERQRTVLQAIIKGLKFAGPVKLLQIANKVFPEIYTSLSTIQILKLASKVLFMKLGTTDGFPYDTNAAYYKKVSYVFAEKTLADNVVALHQKLFGIDNYKATANVKKYSAKIRAMDDSSTK